MVLIWDGIIMKLFGKLHTASIMVNMDMQFIHLEQEKNYHLLITYNIVNNIDKSLKLWYDLLSTILRWG